MRVIAHSVVKNLKSLRSGVWHRVIRNAQQRFPNDSVDVNRGLNSGVMDTPPIETSENLPGILVIDGLFVLPNWNENRFEACTIVNTENSIRNIINGELILTHR